METIDSVVYRILIVIVAVPMFLLMTFTQFQTLNSELSASQTAEANRIIIARTADANMRATDAATNAQRQLTSANATLQALTVTPTATAIYANALATVQSAKMTLTPEWNK